MRACFLTARELSSGAVRLLVGSSSQQGATTATPPPDSVKSQGATPDLHTPPCAHGRSRHRLHSAARASPRAKPRGSLAVATYRRRPRPCPPSALGFTPVAPSAFSGWRKARAAPAGVVPPCGTITSQLPFLHATIRGARRSPWAPFGAPRPAPPTPTDCATHPSPRERCRMHSLPRRDARRVAVRVVALRHSARRHASDDRVAQLPASPEGATAAASRDCSTQRHSDSAALG